MEPRRRNRSAAADVPQHAGIGRLIRDLNQLYREHPALHERTARGTVSQWISVRTTGKKSTYAFVRWDGQR